LEPTRRAACQVSAKYLSQGSLLLGANSMPIKALRGVETIVRDTTTASCRNDIVTELQGYKADIVLCDGAPNVCYSFFYLITI
jgi:AdoMet-dependent rRNA methyltransferase SPB1